MKNHPCTLVASLLAIFVLSVFVACGDGEPETPTPDSTAPVGDKSGESARPAVSLVPSAPPTPTAIAVTPGPPSSPTPGAMRNPTPSPSPKPTRIPSPTATPTPPAEPTSALPPEPTPTPVEKPAAIGEERVSSQPEIPAVAAGEPFLVGNLVEVVAGAGHSCGLREDGSAVCWGRDSEGQASVPMGRFESLSAYRLHTCGARAEGGIQCWGQAPVGSSEILFEDEKFVSVSSISDHLCGLRQDGVALCWSNERGSSMGVEEVPDEEFLSVDVGSGSACGASAEGGVVCWGGDYGEATPILAQDSFSSVRTSGPDIPADCARMAPSTAGVSTAENLPGNRPRPKGSNPSA